MLVPGPARGRAPAPSIVITFIIRRLIATVFLLIVVSMIVYAIFFLLPRLAGQNTYQLATQFVGRNPNRAAVLAIEDKLGLNSPLYLQYGRFLKAIVFGTHYNSGTEHHVLPAAVLRLLVQDPAAGLAADGQRHPGQLSLAVGAAILWLVGGVSIGVSPPCAGAPSSTGSRWASRCSGCRCRSSSPA